MAAERKGSRWLYAEPSEEEVKAWFDTQRFHKGMTPDAYYGGIVIIPATEKYKQTLKRADESTYVKESERLVYTPYVKVDTRIAYFWDLVDTMNEQANDDKYVGVFEPVEQTVIDDPTSAYFNAHLPTGYFILPITVGERTNRYLGAQWSVAIYERESYARKVSGSKELPIRRGIGTKQSTFNKAYADDNVLMKAETGAIGRALGVAGILVVGTGVATAEDMQEAASGPAQPGTATEPTLPATEGAKPAAEPGQVQPPPAEQSAEQTAELTDEQRRARATELAAELRSKYPASYEAYVEWYQGRGFPAINELEGVALNGAVVKLERSLDEAQQATAAEQAPAS